MSANIHSDTAHYDGAEYQVVTAGPNDQDANRLVWSTGIGMQVNSDCTQELLEEVAEKMPDYRILSVNNTPHNILDKKRSILIRPLAHEAIVRMHILDRRLPKSKSVRDILAGQSLGGLITAEMLKLRQIEPAYDVEDVEFAQMQITPERGGFTSLTTKFIGMQPAMVARLKTPKHRRYLRDAFKEVWSNTRKCPTSALALGSHAIEACRANIDSTAVHSLGAYNGRLGFVVAKKDSLTSTQRQIRIARGLNAEIDVIEGGHELAFKPEVAIAHFITQYWRSQDRQLEIDQTTWPPQIA